MWRQGCECGSQLHTPDLESLYYAERQSGLPQNQQVAHNHLVSIPKQPRIGDRHLRFASPYRLSAHLLEPDLRRGHLLPLAPRNLRFDFQQSQFIFGRYCEALPHKDLPATTAGPDLVVPKNRVAFHPVNRPDKLEVTMEVGLSRFKLSLTNKAHVRDGAPTRQRVKSQVSALRKRLFNGFISSPI